MGIKILVINYLFNKLNEKYNKCISRLARRKSHHTALVDAAAPNSECPASVVHNSESPTSITARRHRRHPSPASKCARPPASQQQPLAARAYHSYASRVGLCSAKHVICPWWPWPLTSKWDKTCPDSRPTRMQNFTPLSFSTAEKSVNIQTNKNYTQ